MAGCTVVEGHARFEAPGRVRIGEGVTCSATVFIMSEVARRFPDIPGVMKSHF